MLLLRKVSDQKGNHKKYVADDGHIFVHSGLLEQAETPEELAGVLSHEIAHVSYRHILQGIIVHLLTTESIQWIVGGSAKTENLLNYFLQMRFTRSQEELADIAALERLAITKVSNEGFKQFFQKMIQQPAGADFISDHPPNKARIHMIQNFKDKIVHPILSPEEWNVLKRYCS